MQESYDEVLLQVNDPTWRWSRLREFLTTLVDYARGKVTSIPEVSADPETIREYMRSYYVAVVLMNQGDVDAVIKIGGQGLGYWKERFFSRLWDRDEFREYVIQTGLVDYWRKSGKWGDMCRPRGEDDFECGVFE